MDWEWLLKQNCCIVETIFQYCGITLSKVTVLESAELPNVCSMYSHTNGLLHIGFNERPINRKNGTGLGKDMTLLYSKTVYNCLAIQKIWSHFILILKYLPDWGSFIVTWTGILSHWTWGYHERQQGRECSSRGRAQQKYGIRQIKRDYYWMKTFIWVELLFQQFLHHFFPSIAWLHWLIIF